MISLLHFFLADKDFNLIMTSVSVNCQMLFTAWIKTQLNTVMGLLAFNCLLFCFSVKMQGIRIWTVGIWCLYLILSNLNNMLMDTPDLHSCHQGILISNV